MSMLLANFSYNLSVLLLSMRNFGGKKPSAEGKWACCHVIFNMYFPCDMKHQRGGKDNIPKTGKWL
jgi:hypothetical protein